MFEIERQGRVFAAREVSPVPQAQRGGGARGKITTFSRASRRRLIELTARMALERVRTTFLTLTFSGTPSAAEAARALKQFTMRLRRAFKQMSAIWRQERQARGSIHYHLILFNMPYVPQRQLQRAWEQCTREARSIVDVRLVRGSRQAMAYVSKYVAKASKTAEGAYLDSGTYQHKGENDSIGRQWGYINKDCLPMAARTTAVLLDDELRGYVWWTIRALSRGRGGKSHARALLYTDDAEALFNYAEAHARIGNDDAMTILAARIQHRHAQDSPAMQ